MCVCTCQVSLGELHKVSVYFKSNIAGTEYRDGYIDKNLLRKRLGPRCEIILRLGSRMEETQQTETVGQSHPLHNNLPKATKLVEGSVFKPCWSDS